MNKNSTLYTCFTIISLFSFFQVSASSEMNIYCKYKDGLYNEVIDVSHQWLDSYSENFLKKGKNIYIAATIISREESVQKSSANTKLILEKYDCEDREFITIDDVGYGLGAGYNLASARIDAFDRRFIIYHTSLVWSYSIYNDVKVYDTLRKKTISIAYDMPDISIWSFLWFYPEKTWIGKVQVRNPDGTTSFLRYNLFKKTTNLNLAITL